MANEQESERESQRERDGERQRKVPTIRMTLQEVVLICTKTSLNQTLAHTKPSPYSNINHLTTVKKVEGMY